MNRRARSIVATAGVTIGLFVLAGCSASSPAEFDRPQSEADVLQPPSDNQPIELDSTRYITDVDGYSVYIAKFAETDGGVCIVLVDAGNGDWESSACGGSGGVATTLTTGTVIAVGDNNIPPDVKGDREKVSESVTVVRS